MQIAFVRIPKNASRSIKRTKLFICGRHETIEQMQSKYVFDLSFCVCRNPYARLVSAYTNGRRQFEQKKYPYFLQFCKYPTFKDFCLDSQNPFLHNIVTRMGHDDKPKAHVRHVHYIPQYEWIEPKVDYILRMERLKEDWENFLEDVGLDFVSLGHINKTKHDPWEEYYDDDTAEIVYEYYKKDFIKFKYRKNSWRNNGESI